MELGVTIGESIDLIERVGPGFDFIEYGLGETAPTVTPAAIETATASAGVDLSVHLPFKQVVSTPVPELNDALVTHKRRLLDWAGSLGAEKAVLHGTVRDPYDTGQRDTFAVQLERIITAGRDVGVEVVVENVGHQRNGMQLSVLGEIADAVGAPICFDVGHAYMEEGNDGIDRFLKHHADQISHLHVHDVRRRGDTHLPIGAGEIDYSILADRLAGFTGSVAVEVFTDDRPLLMDTAVRIAHVLEQPVPAGLQSLDQDGVNLS